MTDSISQAGLVLLLAAIASAGMVVMLAPTAHRRALVLAGSGGLVAAVAMVLAQEIAALAVVVLAAAAMRMAVVAGAVAPAAMRIAAVAVIFLVLAGLLFEARSQAELGRLATVASLVGLLAAIGVAPFLQRLEPGRPGWASVVAWSSFLGPFLALFMLQRVRSTIPVSAAPAYAAMLIGFGLLNLLWGGIGAWRARDLEAARRDSLVAEWGLVLVGLGLVVPAGTQAAFLLLLTMLLTRLPLHLLAGRGEGGVEGWGTRRILLGVALAGLAPFAGFPARILLLRAATEIAWPIALLLLAGFVLLLPQAIRLAKAVPGGAATSFATLLILLMSGLIGIFPGLFLRLAGL